MIFQKIKKHISFIIFLLIGLFIFTYPMLFSGFDLIPGDIYKTLYSSYILEHSFLWITKSQPHNLFWSAPFNYPLGNSTAYFESLAGISPLYWLIRIFAQNPFNSFQILFILLCVLNFSTFYYFSNKQLKFSSLSSSIISFIFAFSLMRIFRIFEISYFTQFYSILSIIFLFKIDIKNKPINNHVFFLLFSIFLVLQFYSSFTIGFFTVLIGIIMTICGLLPKNSRDKIVYFFKNFYKHFLFYIFVIFTLLLPMLYHHILTGEITTPMSLLIRMSDWLGWVRNVGYLDTIFYEKLPYYGWEYYSDSSFSLGVITFILACFGLTKTKFKGMFTLTSAIILILSCGYLGISCWKYLYYVLPFSEGLEGISRLSFILLIIFCIAIGSLITFLEENRFKNKAMKYIILSIVILVLTIEQIPRSFDINSYWKMYSLSKKELNTKINQLSNKVPMNCKVLKTRFIATNKEQYGANDIKVKNIQAKELNNLLSLWAALDKKIYSINKPLKIKNEELTNIEGLCIIREKIDYSKL